MRTLRVISVLALALPVMLAVVMLRAETARLHYRMSKLDRQADLLKLEIAQAELQHASIQNPSLIRQRALDLRAGYPTNDITTKRRSP